MNAQLKDPDFLQDQLARAIGRLRSLEARETTIADKLAERMRSNIALIEKHFKEKLEAVRKDARRYHLLRPHFVRCRDLGLHATRGAALDSFLDAELQRIDSLKPEDQAALFAPHLFEPG